MNSGRNRKLLTTLLMLVSFAALIAVYLLYGRSRHEQPNEPPATTTQSALATDDALREA